MEIEIRLARLEAQLDALEARQPKEPPGRTGPVADEEYDAPYGRCKIELCGAPLDASGCCTGWE